VPWVDCRGAWRRCAPIQRPRHRRNASHSEELRCRTDETKQEKVTVGDRGVGPSNPGLVNIGMKGFSD
jgi:hypothetical protein